MRGGHERSGSLFSYVDLEARVGKDHPLRTIRLIVNEALAALSVEFSALYARMGRPSIPPEKLVRAMLLQAFYSIRSERRWGQSVRSGAERSTGATRTGKAQGVHLHPWLQHAVRRRALSLHPGRSGFKG